MGRRRLAFRREGAAPGVGSSRTTFILAGVPNHGQLFAPPAHPACRDCRRLPLPEQGIGGLVVVGCPRPLDGGEDETSALSVSQPLWRTGRGAGPPHVGAVAVLATRHAGLTSGTASRILLRRARVEHHDVLVDGNPAVGPQRFKAIQANGGFRTQRDSPPATPPASSRSTMRPSRPATARSRRSRGLRPAS